LLAIMQDEMLERYHNSNGKTGLTEAYRFYVNMGTISLSPQQVSKHDEILSRSMFKERNGLAGADYDLQQILARCVDEKEVAMEVQETLKADVPESVQFSFDW